jgi:branched-chain amino acid transport system substrate-binding protein
MHSARIRGIRLCAIAAITAAVLSACGSSSSHSKANNSTTHAASTPATTASTASTPASTGTSTGTATGSPLVIGSICSCTGPQAAQFGDANKVITAWANSVNASGGINGHPVKLISLDDAQNPSTSLQDVKKLVEQDHVMAIVSDLSLVDATWAKYVTQKGIPVVGGASPETTFGQYPDFFPSGGTLITLAAGTIVSAQGKKNLGVLYCAESPVCAQIVPLAQLSGSLVGLKITPQKISATAPSYASNCLALKSAGADALYVADNGPIAQRVVSGCAQQGYKPALVDNVTSVTNAILTDPNWSGTKLVGTDANPFDSSLPAIKAFQDAVNKSFPGLTHSASWAYDDIYPWTAGALFQAAAKAGNLGPSSTPADVIKALYLLKNETLGGLQPPITYHPGQPAFTPCWFTEQVSGGQFASLNGDKPTCLTAKQTTTLLSALKKGG